jgi:uncharacterized protein YciI
MVSIGAEPNYFLVTYSPGASWNEALSYEEQPALKLHHEYLESLHVSDMIVMGGTAADNDKGYLSVMLVRTGSLEEAEKMAALDPGVQTRLVRADVVPWNVTMSSMRFIHRRSQPPIHDPDQSFSIKRIDPESRLNIDD